MATLTENRSTLEREGKYFSFPILNTEIMYAGGLGAILTTSGEAQMASDSADLVVIGRVEAYVDNSSDGESVLIKSGVFKLENSASNAVTSAHIGSKCYIEDDHTVSSAGGTNSIVAGVVTQLDSDGVWVDTSAAVIAAVISPAIPQASAVADPAACASMASIGDTSTTDQSTDINANFAAAKTAVDANNSAIAAVVDALQAAGLMA